MEFNKQIVQRRAKTDPSEAALAQMSLNLFRTSEQVFFDPITAVSAKRLAWGRLIRGMHRMRQMLREPTISNEGRIYVSRLLTLLDV